jgi:hypothetical protein
MSNAVTRALLFPVALVALVSTLGVPDVGGLDGPAPLDSPVAPPQQEVTSVTAAPAILASQDSFVAGLALTAVRADVDPASRASSTDTGPREPTRRRGVLFTSLAASFVGLQALDVHSTLRAIDRGAGEANPMMAPFASHPAALVAVKAGAAGGILFMLDRIHARNRLAGVLMMAAANSAYATIVANNYRLAPRASE